MRLQQPIEHRRDSGQVVCSFRMPARGKPEPLVRKSAATRLVPYFACLAALLSFASIAQTIDSVIGRVQMLQPWSLLMAMCTCICRGDPRVVGAGGGKPELAVPPALTCVAVKGTSNQPGLATR